MREPIGGHLGLDVFREAGGSVLKVAYDHPNAAALVNAYEQLRRMDEGFAPRPIDIIESPSWVLSAPTDLPGRPRPAERPDGEWFEHGLLAFRQQDLGPNEPVTDTEILRHSTIRLLRALRASGLRHGDTTSSNLIVKQGGAQVMAIDWQESHRLADPAPQKQPWTDSYMLMRYLSDRDTQGDVPHVLADTPRVARRWLAVLADLGAVHHDDEKPLPLRGRTLIDLGTFQGDFAALAACEGMHVLGVDQGGFRSGEDSIQIAQDRWAVTGDWERIGGTLRFERRNLMTHEYAGYDYALCFSTWPYLVADFGREAALYWLRRVIASVGVLYFETQLHGDGPGPEFLPDELAVAALLKSCGATSTRKIVTLPVVGRPATRTVWAAQRREGAMPHHT